MLSRALSMSLGRGLPVDAPVMVRANQLLREVTPFLCAVRFAAIQVHLRKKSSINTRATTTTTAAVTPLYGSNNLLAQRKSGSMQAALKVAQAPVGRWEECGAAGGWAGCWKGRRGRGGRASMRAVRYASQLCCWAEVSKRVLSRFTCDHLYDARARTSTHLSL
jgi:hypothetical protein